MNYYYCCLLVLFTYIPVAGFLNHDRAADAAQRNDWQRAQELLMPKVVEHPDDPYIAYDAGVIAYKLKQFEQAHACFDAVIKNSQTSSELKEKSYFNRGNVLAEQKMFDQAIESYEKALTINPDNERTKHNLDIVKKRREQQKKEEQNNKDKNKQKDKKQPHDKQKQQQQDQQQSSEKNQNQDSEQDQDKESQQDQKQNADDQSADDSKQQSKQNSEQQQKPGSKSESGQKDGEKHGNDSKDNEAKSESQRQRPHTLDEQTHDKNDNNERKQESKQEFSPDQKNAKKQPMQQPLENPMTGEKKSQESSLKMAQNDDKSQLEKLDAKLLHILQEYEEKDAQLNKKMIKATIGSQLAGQDGQNCW